MKTYIIYMLMLSEIIILYGHCDNPTFLNSKHDERGIDNLLWKKGEKTFKILRKIFDAQLSVDKHSTIKRS